MRGLSTPHGRSEGVLSPPGGRREAPGGPSTDTPHGRSEGVLSPPGGRREAPAGAAASQAAWQREARRQQQLLDALFEPGCAAPLDASAGWPRGIRAYRANAAAHASDTLRAQYPGVLAMLGGEAFDALASAHWHACPPAHGDLARFGEGFPAWLRQRDDLAAWPWLADCARLEQALWQLQFAPPAALRDDDLQRLASCDPDALRLRLAPATRLVEADWAVVALRELHAAREPDLRAIAQALQAGPQVAWAWRQGFEVHCVALDAGGARWIRALREEPTLGAALARSDEDFDVGGWLGDAVRAGWIDGVDSVTREETRA